MSRITLRVNGRSRTVDTDPATPLLFVLSDDLELSGPKFGCGLGQCGCCTVIVKGQAVRSCITPVSAVGTADITMARATSILISVNTKGFWSKVSIPTPK